VQNVDAFSIYDSIVKGDGIQYETARALGKGERIFITAKLPRYIQVGNDDLIEKYLFLTTSHNGFGSITAAFTPVRIVCNNTLNAALANHSNAIKIRHTANAKQKLEQAHRLMGITNHLSSQLEEVFNNWSKIRITDSEVKKLIQRAMVPNKEVLQTWKLEKTMKSPPCSKIWSPPCMNMRCPVQHSNWKRQRALYSAHTTPLQGTSRMPVITRMRKRN
jgi:phage/plasmid-like protein (TIGR03299 family)